MGWILAALFFGIPALEIYVIIKVGAAIGVISTLGVIAGTAVLGAWLARTQGVAAVRGVAQAVTSGREIGESVAGAALVLAAAVAMLTPGFVTDALGLALLVPPIRGVCARALVRWAAHRVSWTEPGNLSDYAARSSQPPPPGVIDV